MSDTDKSPKTSKPLKQKPFFLFLGSMNLAVTLLMMLAIASVIGTVLQQDQNFQDYIIEFGPFWTQVFNTLGLFHVYGAAWFILVLLFLLVSTTTCVSRNGPTFMQDMKQFSEKLSINAYKHQPYSETYTVENFEPEKAALLLKEKGFKTKIYQRNNGITVAGMKGRFNRLGYIFTHASIIIICIGALFDSNLLLKFREMTGGLVAETRAIPVNDIPAKSWLGEDNFSFRGSVNVVEGQKTDVLFLPYERGFLVQKLPFSIEVKEFRIKYYDTGMPKSFESDIVLTAPDLKKPIVKTIRVNQPLYYKNYAIYQSSFGDGGSELSLKVHPLLAPEPKSFTLKTTVDSTEPLKTPLGTFNVEFSSFRMFNIVPSTKEEKAKTGKKVHNNGPSIGFKVRNDQGKAWEYDNFMLPSKQDNRYFFMTGVRDTPTKPFRYLFIPADEKKSNNRFFQFLAVVNNPIKTNKFIREAIPKTDKVDPQVYRLQIRLLNQLLVLFRQKGFEGINEFVEKSVPKAEQKKVRDYYLSQTSTALQILYLGFLKETYGKDYVKNDVISNFDSQWFEDALVVINTIPLYGPPMYFELTGFKQIDSTGLQITKSPGKNIVYLGSTFLIIGVFFLFYLRQKRVWIAYSETDKTLTVAGKDTRDLPETQKEFEQLLNEIKQKL